MAHEALGKHGGFGGAPPNESPDVHPMLTAFDWFSMQIVAVVTPALDRYSKFIGGVPPKPPAFVA